MLMLQGLILQDIYEPAIDQWDHLMNRFILPILFFFCLSSFVIGQDKLIMTDDTHRAGYDTSMKPIEVVIGQNFSFTLETNPTTGYKWELAGTLDQGVVKFIANEYKAAEPRRIGSGGNEIWTFQAVGAGSAKITLQYVRSWERPFSPVKTSIFYIIVGK